MSDDTFEIDKFEPDYEQKCGNCGQTPIVTAIRDGKVVHDFEMCGVCTFGTAKALDPNYWNGED